METGAPSDASASEEDRSKDAFYAQVGQVAQDMTEKHGKDFAMGVLVLCARFLAEGKPVIRPQ